MMSRCVIHSLFLLVALLASYSFAATSEKISLQASQRSLVFETIKKRLYLMQDVAIHKHKNGLATENKAVEKKVIRRAIAQSLRYGMDSHGFAQFMQAQIAGAKRIQDGYRTSWQKGSPVPNKQVRLSRLREEIGAQSQVLVASVGTYLRLYGALENKHRAEYRMALEEIPYLTDTAKASIFDSLMSLSLVTVSQNKHLVRRSNRVRAVR